MHRKFTPSKQAIGTVTAVFMLLIMITAMTILVTFFLATNTSMQEQMTSEKEQAQEQISITSIGIGNAERIANITIKNTGTVEVVIRAIYRKDVSATSLLIDPKMAIPPGTSGTVDMTSLGLTMQQGSSFSAATERGVRSMDVNEVEINYRDYTSTTNSSALSIGPLWLTFDSLNWARVDGNGNIQGDWTQTWTVPTGTCSWRLNVTNIDTEKRNITMNQYSGFTISSVGSPSTTTWYLKDLQQTVDWNTTKSLVFLWDSVRSSPVSVISNQRGVNNVFLTFFGNYSDGKDLAQTIPFEAVTVT